MINVNTGFHIQTSNPIDDRFIKKKSEMVRVNDNTMPEIYPCWCTDDDRMYIYNKSNTFNENTGKFRVFEGGSGGSTVDIEQSSDNGYIKVDGSNILVFDDTELKDFATHENQKLLEKLSLSNTEELLYDGKKVGNYFYSSSIENTFENANNETLCDIQNVIEDNYFIISSELLLQNKSMDTDAVISVLDSGVEIMTITLLPEEIQKYNLGSSMKIKVLGTGNIFSKLDINYCRRSVNA